MASASAQADQTKAAPASPTLEQVNAVLGCGGYGRVGYVLTGQCGPRKPGEPAPPSYEVAQFFGNQAMLLMSLMNGGPPYAICDSYTWRSPPVVAASPSSTKAKAKAKA